MELLILHIPEQWKKRLKAKEGGKEEEETRKYQKKYFSVVAKWKLAKESIAKIDKIGSMALP